jgi:hypothetical protein
MYEKSGKRVVVVHWKRFAGIEIDVFNSLRGFCDSYPNFDYRTINTYLTEKNIPFENDEVKIEILPLINEVRRPNLPRSLFWEFDFDKIDWRRSYRTIIERVLDAGSVEHWEEMIRFYSRENVIHALKNDIGYLTDHTVGEVCITSI